MFDRIKLLLFRLRWWKPASLSDRVLILTSLDARIGTLTSNEYKSNTKDIVDAIRIYTNILDVDVTSSYVLPAGFYRSSMYNVNLTTWYANDGRLLPTNDYLGEWLRLGLLVARVQLLGNNSGSGYMYTNSTQLKPLVSQFETTVNYIYDNILQED